MTNWIATRSRRIWEWVKMNKFILLLATYSAMLPLGVILMIESPDKYGDIGLLLVLISIVILIMVTILAVKMDKDEIKTKYDDAISQLEQWHVNATVLTEILGEMQKLNKRFDNEDKRSKSDKPK